VSAHTHVLSVTVRDQPGVLMRIAGLFARRGFNIESLSVAQSETPGISRTTFTVSGEDVSVEQVQKQLQKLIDVIKVIDHSEAKFVDRELMLLKVSVRSPDDRVELRQIAQDFRAVSLTSTATRSSSRSPATRARWTPLSSRCARSAS
jgi:acetolactate synthase-1/3 small subunit